MKIKYIKQQNQMPKYLIIRKKNINENSILRKDYGLILNDDCTK